MRKKSKFECTKNTELINVRTLKYDVRTRKNRMPNLQVWNSLDAGIPGWEITTFIILIHLSRITRLEHSKLLRN
jgi:hypothetical protein